MHHRTPGGRIALVVVLGASAVRPSGVLSAAQAGAATDTIRATVQGQFRRAPATAAERTGFQVTANGVTWEVDLSADPKLLRAGDQLDGQPALVAGTYAERKGASGIRRILTAERLDPARAGGRRDYIDVTVSGTLRTGVMAIAAETTGVTITAGPVVWELELAPGQHDVAARLSGRPVVVSGELRRQAGVEIPARFLLAVRRFEPQ